MTPGRILRRGLLLAGPGLLWGCGFRPMYAPRPAGEAGALPPIRVGLIADREGQLLRQGLRERLTSGGTATGTAHDLSVSLSFESSDVGIRSDGTATRSRILGSARFRLQPEGATEPVLAGVARTLDAVNLLDLEFFASQLAQEAARRRIVEALADDIAQRVSAHFARLAAG